MIIDCHTHLGDANGKNWTPDALIASMDETGIDTSIIISEIDSGELSTIDSMLQTTASHPRLKLIAHVDFATLDDRQITRLTELLETNRAIGIKCYLGYEEYYASDEKLFPLYEYCSTHGKPVMFHTGSLERANSGLLKYAHPLTVDEVANAFPKLNIIIAHMGNPWLMDCAAVMSKNENVYADMSAFFEEYAPITHDDTDIFVKRLQDVRLFLGSYEKFLFGTDWPLYSQKEYVTAVEALPLTPDEHDRVFWKNARDMFHL